MIYTVRKLNIGKTDQLDSLALASGDVYSRCVTSFWRTVRKQGIWLKPASMMRWHTSDRLHAHTADACVQSFYASLKSWRARRQIEPNVKPPWKRRRFFRVEYKSDSIRKIEGNLVLSNGRKRAPLLIPWRWGKPRHVTIHWTGGQYEAIAVYAIADPVPVAAGETAGIDLGEIHMAVSHDGVKTHILNGRLLRSKRQYQNRIKARLSSLVDRKQKGSNRRKRMIRSKKRQLKKLDNQIRDILHKQTTRLISTLHQEGVQKVVIGDVRDIRQDLDYGKKANQKLHQWVHGKTRRYLAYKSVRLGMESDLQEESYTSQDCPCCGSRYKPRGRNYHCGKCVFAFHRDGVGAINIRKKYLGLGPVIGDMAPPTGIRFRPHARVARMAECADRETAAI